MSEDLVFTASGGIDPLNLQLSHQMEGSLDSNCACMSGQLSTSA